jgi:hypothetical protein
MAFANAFLGICHSVSPAAPVPNALRPDHGQTPSASRLPLSKPAALVGARDAVRLSPSLAPDKNPSSPSPPHSWPTSSAPPSMCPTAWPTPPSSPTSSATTPPTGPSSRPPSRSTSTRRRVSGGRAVRARVHVSFLGRRRWCVHPARAQRLGGCRLPSSGRLRFWTRVQLVAPSQPGPPLPTHPACPGQGAVR